MSIVRNKRLYKKVIEFRKSGKSYSEISNNLNLAKSTISN
jgi:orotate phosphoribosyltransferase-like protein